MNDFEEKMRTEKFFKYISMSDTYAKILCSGGQEGIARVKKMLDSDPKKHMYDIDSRYHILNRWNTQRQSPLYLAAKHGHLDMMTFLLDIGADPKFPSLVSRIEQETILDVSVRWSHVHIVSFLLARVQWTKDEIMSAFEHVKEESDNNEIR